MKKLVSFIFGLYFATITLANQISYNQIPITPQTWEEVDLTYINTIDGKEYTEHVNLLRPISWIKQNHLDKVDSTVHLTKEQLGMDTNVRVITIKPTKLNYSNDSHTNSNPVIATFITHNKEVWEYTFKDQNGHSEVIHAVAGHHFYSADRQAFIPIGLFKVDEHIKTNNQNVNLSKKYKLNKKIYIVYNFETYKVHTYDVGKTSLLVHNPIDEICADMTEEGLINGHLAVDHGKFIHVTPEGERILREIAKLPKKDYIYSQLGKMKPNYHDATIPINRNRYGEFVDFRNFIINGDVVYNDDFIAFSGQDILNAGYKYEYSPVDYEALSNTHFLKDMQSIDVHLRRWMYEQKILQIYSNQSSRIGEFLLNFNDEEMLDIIDNDLYVSHGLSRINPNRTYLIIPPDRRY